MCKHITLLMPNRPGQLHEVTLLLKEKAINILGHGLSCGRRSGVLYTLCYPHDLAFRLLREKYSYYCTEAEVLVVKSEHRPGSLNSILKIVHDENINVANSYQSFSSEGDVLIVLEFDSEKDLNTVQEILLRNHYDVMIEQPS